MEFAELIEKVGKHVGGRGFDPKKINTQLIILPTEIAEAFRFVKVPVNMDARILKLITDFIALMQEVEYLRKTVEWGEASKSLDATTDPEKFMEEIADLAIRVMFFVWGNYDPKKFEEKIISVLERDDARGEKHGKKE